jgi:hypothetical protein
MTRDWPKVIAELEDKLGKTEDGIAQRRRQKEAIALRALTGDKRAAEKLAQLNAAILEAQVEVEDVGLAIAAAQAELAKEAEAALRAEEAARVRRLSELAEDRIRRAKALEDAVVTLAQLLAEDDRLNSDMCAVRPNDDKHHRRCAVNHLPFLQVHLGRWLGLLEGSGDPRSRLSLQDLYTAELGTFVLSEKGLAKLGEVEAA